MRLFILLATLAGFATVAAEPEFPLTEDSKPQPGVAKGEMIKGSYTANETSLFPGTEREYQLYLPAGLDKTKPAAFMVFQDGVIYQAPTVFDNLIAKKDIPPLVGIFIKPGVVPAANDNALPRFNRSYEYDSVTDTYGHFLTEEFLPAIEQKHGIKLSTDPNQAAIAGNSSGGICAFMAAWHRPDRFRRVFTGVGTYVGIHGADQLPVLVRKFEPKPIRVFLQSGTNDNNLYCGDWWMANQMMERSLTWAGYDVNHAWGDGGHNQKHASQVFPDAMRWLWREWQTNIQVKANPKGESKWKGYEVVGEDGWMAEKKSFQSARFLAANQQGDVIVNDIDSGNIWRLSGNSKFETVVTGLTRGDHGLQISDMAYGKDGMLVGIGDGNADGMSVITEGRLLPFDGSIGIGGWAFCRTYDGWFYMSRGLGRTLAIFQDTRFTANLREPFSTKFPAVVDDLTLSPDQTLIYMIRDDDPQSVWSYPISADHWIDAGQRYFELETPLQGAADACGLCVDTDGRLYVATSLGIQVCDQAGRVNFIIPTPKQPYDICFGGKDLSELFIACGDTIYKRPTKVHGIVSGQMPPVKPAPPKL